MKKGLKALYGSKLGKLLPVLVIAGMVATASASVFVLYYGHTTATVATPDVQLVAGADAASSSAYKPTVSLASTSDFATVGITFFPSVTQGASHQPNIYYTDLLEVNNAGASSHSINSISISNIVDSSSSLGVIDVFYCLTQTNSPVAGANCELFAIINTSSPSGTGSVTFPSTLAASGTNFIEVVAHAASGATATSTVTFDVQISWA